MEHIEQIYLALSRIQFIAEISLTACCKHEEMEMALYLISDLADECLPNNGHEEVFYKVASD
ncbi:Uncharacterised protein [Yersinia frederiksenii]|uniref:Uncharacterized protein n=2 Tax=Yersinia frederiksenii TaxID=29484 RepID=A0A380PN56_YERFR|nr:hypothetical protein [Yersinia frederiksenii]ATM96248.1 hypothetical protein CRN75_13310 [Yersinia frederiksenii]KGA47985.1 putative gTP-binding protein Era [Yersinia frederiksenii ATCC 33641]SUP75017.1 Uncharacterised protein [Yersinia frederiksenii]SUP75054.1 Uncharacterised protein [Yersinia frederiksenii]